MSEGRRPRLKADVRRALMIQSLSIGLKHNQIQPGDDALQQRADLRLRTLRLLFSCRSFPAAFFQRSERYGQPNVHLPMLTFSSLHSLQTASTEPFCLYLYGHYMSVESMGRFLHVGRAEVRRLSVFMKTYDDPSFEQIRDWATISRPLKDCCSLQELNVGIDYPPPCPAIVHFLRDFLPARITSFRSTVSQDFLCERNDAVERIVIRRAEEWNYKYTEEEIRDFQLALRNLRSIKKEGFVLQINLPHVLCEILEGKDERQS
ncbi:hypothetical protein M3Y99_00101200 [Aphelenchoides fujianensis]|nr:hypothetical protein M3Y99_00101200 [Aphelenchoides fujianensis]